MMIFDKQKQLDYFHTGVTLEYKFRMDMLFRFKNMLKQNQDKIVAALKKDFGKSYFESYATEMLMIHDELNYMLKNL